VVNDIHIISKPVEEITINMDDERYKIESQWQGRIIQLEKDFETRLAQVIE
jgi:hypothetical protein